MDQDAVVEELGKKDVRGERGASLVEYALLVALIAAVAVGALRYLGTENGSGLDRSKDCITLAMDGAELPANC